MHRRSCVSSSLFVSLIGFAVLCGGVRTAGATTVDLLPHARLLDHNLQFPGSGGDGAFKPLMNPILAESLVGFGTALVSVPFMEFIGYEMRNISSNIYANLIPVVLLLWVVPTVAVTFAEWGVGRALHSDVRIQPAIYIAAAVQLVVVVGGLLIGVWVGDFTQAALFSLVEVVLLPGTITAAMNIQLGLRTQWKMADVVLPATAPATDHAPERLANGLSVYHYSF